MACPTFLWIHREAPLPWRAPLLGLAAILVATTTGCSGDSTTTAAGGMAGTVATAGGGSGGAPTAGTTTGGAGSTSAGAPLGGTSGGGMGGTSVVPNGGSAGSGGTGGTGGTPGDTTIPPTFEGLKSILKLSCFGGVCHDLPEHPLQLGLNDKLYGTLTTHMTEGCGVVVKPGSPQDSALVKLLKGPCGGTDRMPLNKCTDDGDEGCVKPADIAAIEQWIAAGAPQ